MMRVGDQAPPFRAPSSQGQTLDSEAFLGKVPVVLFFFPKAGTPGCDREIAAFNEHLKDFGKRRVQVLGVSRDTPRDLRRYAEEHDIRVPLLADEGSRIIREYGVDGEHGIARRVTFVLDLEGNLAEVFDEVNPSGHAEEVLAALDRLREERPETMSRG